MDSNVAELAYHGNWNLLLPLLRAHPHLINVGTESKGYSPLHQAAWHGADLSVVGALLALGADRRQKTKDKNQTAYDIAIEKYADRYDLEYVFAPGSRNLSQLIRKVVADTQDLFGAYDGNQVVCDQLIECFCADWDGGTDGNIDGRMEAAFLAVPGQSLASGLKISFGPAEHFKFVADSNFWSQRFFPALKENVSRAYTITIEKNWAVISDLFDPAPTQWGLRGDRFLWMEMRRTFCHTEIPAQPEDLANVISAAFKVLTGADLEKDATVQVKRFARGGMSGGMLSGEFWSDKFIPLIVQRAKWLRETWGWSY